MKTSALRIAYIVQRFPVTSETFIVREINALLDREEFDITLMSLLPSTDDFLHEAARPLLPRLRRPAILEAARATGYWLRRRPLRLLWAAVRVAAGAWRDPRTLIRSLAILPIGATHARTVREEGIGHVHAHFAALPTLAAWLCGRLCDVPYSFTAHAYDIFASQALLAMKVAEAEFVVTVSEFNRRFLRDYGGDRKAPVVVSHPGIDPHEYKFRERSVPRHGPVRALCVASLVAQKGHSVLLDALASNPALNRISIDLIGGGELRDDLERRSHELGLREQVHFHGPRTESEVRAMLDRADLFVLPSIIAPHGRMEGLPSALVEAFACGVPTVSTRISGIPELITHRRTGVLAEPGDPDSLASALDWVAGGAELDLVAARRTVETDFDVWRAAARMAQLFRVGVTADLPRDQ